MTTLLTENEYKETMSGKMVDATTAAEASVDIWPYVAQLAKTNKIPNHVYENQWVEMVSRNSAETFDHVLLQTSTPNIFIVIIIDLKKENIKGHFKLDLNKEYGLT